MSDFIGINLKEMIVQIGENKTQTILSDFSCPQNPDVEKFLKHTAIEFAKQSISSTYLVMSFYKNDYVLVGYYTLSNKFFHIHKESFSSKNLRNRIKNLRSITLHLNVTLYLHHSLDKLARIFHIHTTL